MTEITPEAYTSHARTLAMILAQTLSCLDNLGQPVSGYILDTLQHLIPLVKRDETVSIMR